MRKSIGRPTVGRRHELSKSNRLRTFRNVNDSTKAKIVTGSDLVVLNYPTEQEECLFLRQNDYWIIQYHGHAAFFKSTRGLCHLGVLLRDPGREFYVTDLLAATVAANRRIKTKPYDGIPVLDAQAKAEYKRRLNDLREDLNEAERFNDPQRKTEVQNELRVISARLASAVGLGGRDRKTSSDTERARSAVTKSIKKAIKKIGEAIPSLGYHFAARIKTGYFCSYNPHPDRPVAWKF
jgi:non-specific serine/threonine protein kinase